MSHSSLHHQVDVSNESLSRSSAGKFVVATPSRSVCDDNARALEASGWLRFLALGTRRGTRGVPPERTRLAPLFGLLNYAGASLLSTYRAESLRFSLHPLFDRWVKRMLIPGDHIVSSYGYANECFKWVRHHGGKTFLDGGNSHPDHFWRLLCDEYERWHCPTPPVARFYYERNKAMMEHVDFVLAPSTFVRDSFLAHGFQPSQILPNIYPVDLSCFSPPAEPRPKSRALTIINTGMISLRKGAPYLFEAFRLIHQRHPSVRFLLTRNVHDSAKPILSGYRDLPIDWSPPLPHAELAQRLRGADVFVLPSIEEGLVRTAIEAMSCGLPVVLTPNTGANDFVQPGVNGDVVPVRNPKALAEATLHWGERRVAGERIDNSTVRQRLAFDTFETEFLTHLHQLGLIPNLKLKAPAS